MPSTAEIRAQLTGPGGPFEVVNDVVGGVEMKTYQDRFGDLRVVAQFGLAHADKEFIVHGDRRITFGDFVRTANSVSAGLTRAGVRHGDRVAVLSQNNPEWCLTFWGTVDLGAVLVGLNGWWNDRRDPLRARGLGRQGPGGRPQALRADRGAGRRHGLARARVPDRRGPVRVRRAGRHRQPQAAPLRRAHGRSDRRASRTWRSPRTTPPSSSTRRARPVGPRARSRRTAT